MKDVREHREPRKIHKADLSHSLKSCDIKCSLAKFQEASGGDIHIIVA